MLARRTMLKGLAGLPLAAILGDPHLARAAAETTRLIRITTAGGREVGASLAIPEVKPAPAV
ncbi:MAG: dienelactone hydrolase family protein, partial [Rhodospirillales bacterium]|nr:dienelactone hydrolase family protein [Rhodospirillales bacterium]